MFHVALFIHSHQLSRRTQKDSSEQKMENPTKQNERGVYLLETKKAKEIRREKSWIFSQKGTHHVLWFSVSFCWLKFETNWKKWEETTGERQRDMYLDRDEGICFLWFDGTDNMMKVTTDRWMSLAECALGYKVRNISFCDLLGGRVGWVLC